ncbi:MAG: hypothetical protein LC803_11020 [Acidobacteria bacterium]|nr:hypothetical protein [Acidobacteriota bacterium]
MFNIQKAVSRLKYAPKLSEIEITDIKRGLGVFTPKPDQPVSFAALKAALKKAGYALDRAEMTVAGTRAREGQEWVLIVEPSGQRFALESRNLEQLMAGVAPNARAEITGNWKTDGTGVAAREVITPREVKKVEPGTNTTSSRAASFSRSPAPSFIKASYDAPEAKRLTNPVGNANASIEAVPPSPIRVTLPGLTVYKGGAFTPRLYFIKQHLGDLEVNRQMLDVSVSYTPTATLQLEAEVPVSRTSFDDGVTSGSGVGLGNITLWGKYRFYRTVKTYGDRQAAARFGLELPTGRKTAPSEREVNAPAYVRQQLTPISGGLSPHIDATFSQAGGRFIFGGNVEGILRSERDGFQTGHEVRINSAAVPGSNSTEYYIAPGL